MIGFDEAKRTLRRLASLRGYPRESAGENELIAALQSAPDVFSAEQFSQDWLRSNPAAPYPTDIYASFRRSRPDPIGPRCFRCDGSGFESIYELVTFGPAGFKVIKREFMGTVKDQFLTDDNRQPLREFAKVLPDNQDIRESARKCQCKGAQ